MASPQLIWQHAFQNQISDAARHTLLCLYTLGEGVAVRDLEPAFASLHHYSGAKYQHRSSPEDFRSSLRELDGAFLSYASGNANYLNPSIRDFIASVICNNVEIADDLKWTPILGPVD
jgi:hypothetical protein